MNLPWQQPVRPLEVCRQGYDNWMAVLFIRPRGERQWEAITFAGTLVNSDIAYIREVVQ